MREGGELLEWARVFDNFYGTPRAPVEAAIAQRPRHPVRHRLAGRAAALREDEARRRARVHPAAVGRRARGAPADARAGSATRSCAGAWRRRPPRSATGPSTTTSSSTPTSTSSMAGLTRDPHRRALEARAPRRPVAPSCARCRRRYRRLEQRGPRSPHSRAYCRLQASPLGFKGMRVRLGSSASPLALLCAWRLDRGGVPSPPSTLGDVSQARSAPPSRARSCASSRRSAAPLDNAKAYRILYRSTGFERRADRGLRHRHLSGRPGAAREAATSLPGRICTTGVAETLRADAAARSLRHHRRPRRHAGARLRRGRHRLRGPRRSRRASLSRRHQRGARGARQRARRARAPRRAQATDRFAVWGHSQGGHAALFTGELAAEYAPGAEARRRRGGGAGNLSRRAVQGRPRLDRRQQPHRHGAAVVVAGLSAPARQRAGGERRCAVRAGREQLHPVDRRASEAVAGREAAATHLPEGRPDHAAGVARDHGAQHAGPGAGRSAGVHRAGNGGHDGEARDHSALCQATVRRRHAGRA